MANALENPAVVGKTLFLGSGKHSQTTWLEFINIVPKAMGIGELPASAFGDAPYYTDWMDTEESQRLLNFQQFGLEAYRREVVQQMRVLRVLLWPFRPLIRRFMLSRSAVYGKR
jgi:hypothetical protein